MRINLYNINNLVIFRKPPRFMTLVLLNKIEWYKQRRGGMKFQWLYKRLGRQLIVMKYSFGPVQTGVSTLLVLWKLEDGQENAVSLIAANKTVTTPTLSWKHLKKERKIRKELHKVNYLANISEHGECNYLIENVEKNEA